MVENGFTLPPGQPTNGFGGTLLLVRLTRLEILD